ncbi:hypothetical protein ACFX15_031757 [Malus domestica]
MGGIVQSSSKSDIEAVKNNNLFERFVVDEASKASHKEHGEVSFDEYNSEELVSLDEDEPSDEEGIVVKKVRRKRKAPRFKKFKRETDLFNPNFYLGMEFPSMKACREAVRCMDKDVEEEEKQGDKMEEQEKAEKL